MPTLAHVPHGKVTALWGTAFVRSPNGKMRLLRLGDLVSLGDVILTSQDGIVQISGEDGEPRDPRLALAQPDGAEPKAALVPDEIEQVIQALNNNDPGVAPAAGVAGGGEGGELSPGLRVDRIIEVVTPQAYAFTTNDRTAPEFTTGNQIDGSASAAAEPAKPGPFSGAEDSRIPVALVPGGTTAASVTVTSLPPGSALFLADGVTPVAVGQVLTPAQAAGLVFVPAPDFNGATQIGFSTTDAQGNPAASDSVAVTVTPVNDAPIAVDDAIATPINTPVTVAVLGNDRDVDSGSLSLAGATLADPSQGMLSVNADGTLTFTPAANVSGPVTIRYTVRDAEGASDTAEVTVNVGGNTAPDSADRVVAGLEDQPVTLGLDDFPFTDADAGQSLAAVRIDSLPGAGQLLLGGSPLAAGSLVSAADIAAGRLQFVPAANASGAPYASLSFSVQDSAGAFDPTPNTLTLGIAPVNDAPVAAPDTATTLEDTPLSGNVLANDSDTDGDALSITGFSVAGLPGAFAAGSTASLAGVGTFTLAADGRYTFTPAPQYSGPVPQVTYTVSDGAASSAGTLALSVTPVNDAPAAVGDTITTDEDTPVTIAVLGNDSDADGGTLAVTAINGTAIAVGSPVLLPQGSVGLNADGTLTFTPGTDYNGPAVFDYTVSDGQGGSSTASVTVTVNPVADVTTVSLAATPAVTEGGTIVYAASLTGPAQAPLTLTLTNGAVITIAAGASSGSVAVPAPADDAYLDAGSVSAGIASASGGGFESLAVDPAAATTVVADTLDTTTLSLTASPGVAEGGQITYTASLNAAAQSPVTVTLSNGATITIPAGASAGSVSLPAPADDVYADGGSVAITLAGASGGNFENLVLNGNAAVTSVSDTIDTTTVSLTASPAAAEGGSVVYTASLTAVAQSPVTVTLSNGATITIPAGASAASVSVNAPADDAYADAGNVSASIASATGGGFENLVTDATPAVTGITDTLDTTTVSLTASPAVAEGGQITYTASLTAAAQTPVTVTLSNGATITIPAGASTGTVHVAAPSDDAYADAGSVSATIASASGGNFEQLAVNPAAATTAVTDTADTTTVSLGASPAVAEGGSIVYTASLTAPAQIPVTVTLSNGSVITVAAGASTGSVSVPAPTDDVHLDAGSVSATIAGASGGNFEQLHIDPAAATTSVADTIDTTTVSLTASPSVAEGGQITYTASLTSAAQTPVAVTLTNGAVITIAAGASTGSVSVPAPADDAYLDAGSVSASIASASGGNFEQLAVNPATATTAVTDTPDTTTVSLSASPSAAEGGQITYTASLTAPAQGPVTVTLSNGAVITIAAGASTGSVNVPAPADDVYADAGSVSATIAGASGGNFEQISVDPAAATTAITDTPDTTTVSLTASPSVAEGGFIVYTAGLTAPAQGPVTVTLSNGATITIAAGASTGSVSVAAPADDAYADAGSVSATITSATGGNFEQLFVNPAAATTTVTDTPDATTVSLSASPSVAEGGQITYTASLSNPAQGAVTVTLSNGTVITIPAGASTGSVNVSAPTDDMYLDAGSVAATIASATGGNFEQLQVNPAAATTTVTDTLDLTTLSLSASPAVAEGGSIVYTASLTAPAQTPVTVTLSNGSVITIAAGASTGSVSVPAPTDDVHLDAGSVSAAIAGASGGNFEQLHIDPAAATTSVADTIDTTTVSLTASPSVAEGGQITYTASLTSAAQTPVAVTLTNGAVITIAAGASTGSVSVPAPANDVYTEAVTTPVVVSARASLVNGVGARMQLWLDGQMVGEVQVDNTTYANHTFQVPGQVGRDAQLDVVFTNDQNSGGQDRNLWVSSVTVGQHVMRPSDPGVVIDRGSGAQAFDGVNTIAGQTGVLWNGALRFDVPASAFGVASVSAGIAGAVGGNFENLVVNGTPAATTVAEVVDTTTVSLTASPSVAEGGQITYTASLTAPAQSAVTVTLSNGATITIPAGASTGSVSVAAPADDVYADAGNVPATIASASGGNFEQLAVNPAAAITAVTDTTDTSTVSLSASANVAEGGQITYTASLTAVAQSPVTVTLSNGAVITIPAGASTGSVSVNAPADDVHADAGTVSATIASANGGGFENLAVNPAAASTAVSDTVDVTTVSLGASASVAEGGQITYTASLTSAAQGAVTVILSNGAVITIPAGASSGSVSVNAPADDVYADAGTVSAGIASASGGNFEQLAVNPATATTAVTDTTDTTTVSLAATPGVAEGGQITYTASLTAPAQGPVTVTLSNGAAITIAAGASTGSVSVNAPADDVYTDAGTVSATITGASGGGFEQLAVNPAAASTAVSDTLDTTTVSLTGSPSVAEGGFIVYTASLTAPAQSPVTVTLSNGAVITINAGSSTGSVNVPAPADDAHVDGSTVSVTIGSASGGGFEQLAVNPAAVGTAITDTVDSTTLSLSATPAVAEGGFITYTASLTAPAQTAMVVTLSNGSTIAIAAGASTGSVSLPAPADDVYTDAGNVSVQITGASGGNFEQLSVNGSPAITAVSDTLDTTTVSLSATPAVAEGGQITYTATLGAPAQTAMVVALSNGASISIPAGSSVGSVSVPAPAEDVYADAGSVSVQIASASGGNFEQLAVDTTPAVTAVSDTLDTTTVSLGASPAVAEGGHIVYTASLGAPAQSPVTVTLSNGATITIAAGSSTGNVTVPAPGDNVYADGSTLSVTISGASGGGFERLEASTTPADTTVTDTVNTTTVSLAGSGSVAEGGTASYTVSLTSLAATAVTVTLAYGGTAADGTDFTGVATLTIPAGASSAGFDIATLNDTLAEGAENFTVSLVSAAGGSFESLVVSGSNGSVTTGIVDDDVAALSLGATPGLTEAGGTITYTATLTQAPVSPLSVTLSNGATITIAAGALSGTVDVPLAAADDVYVDPGSVSAAITSISGGGIAVVVDATPAVTTVGDTVDATTVSLSATPVVTEGGSIVYTASLTSAAQSPVTVTLSNGATITIAAGATTGTVSLTAGDDVYAGGASVSARIATATGGNFENLVADTTPAATTVTDTADTTTVSLTASPSAAEGGQITYTASLTSVAQSPVTVTLSNGATLTIPAGTSSATVDVAAPTDDVYLDAGSVSATITSASGGGFEQLAIDPAAAGTTITDTPDSTTVSLAASPSAAEGGQITYTASLTAPAQSDVTVALSNGAVITIAAGSSSGSVSVNAPGDDVYTDAGNVSATISSATGGNFENLLVDPAAATTTVSDTIDTATVSLSATPTVAEGGQITYTASLTAPAQSAVTVTLSNGATLTIPAGASSASVGVNAPADDVYADAGNVSATISSAIGGGFEQLAVNPAAATTSVTDTVDDTTVSLSATPTVAEGGQITYTASLGAAAQGPVTVTLSNGAVIHIAAGANSGSVSINAPGDDVLVDAGNVSATISAATGGGFERLVVNPAAATTAVTDTQDTTTVSLSATPTVAEGGQITYTASLTGAAQTPVTVTLSNGATITIAAGASSGSVSVNAPADDAYADAGTVSAAITGATGGNFENLVVNPAAAATTVTDTSDDTTVSLTATPTVAEGGQITYTASLTAAAQGPVTVTLSNGAVITIPAGASSASVSVNAPGEDVYLDAGSVSATISSATGGGFENLVASTMAASTTVTDTVNDSTVSLTASPSVAEGGSITYTASLTSPAQTPVTVTLSNGEVITIAAGASSGTASVVVADDVYQGGGSVSATITGATGGNFENLRVNPAAAATTITDTTTDSTVTLAASPSVAEGGQITYTASLTSPAQAPVTVTLSNGAVITIAAGSSSGSVSLNAPGDDVYTDAGNVSATISGATGGSFENLRVNPAAATTTVSDTIDTATVSLSATPTVAEGGQITYTASLTAPAQTPVSVTLDNGAVIDIAAGASSGSVSVNAPTDDVYLDAGSVSATIAGASGGNFENLAVNTTAATTTLTDTTDTTTVSLTASPSVAEGGQITYTASLGSPAQTPVTVTLSNGATISIAAGASTGTVSLNAPADDVYVDAGSVSATITGATGGNFEQLAVNPAAATTAITDTVNTTTVSLSASASVAEGGQIVYTASLTSAAQGPVTVTLSNGAVITIAAGSSSGSVNVDAPTDDVYLDAGSVSATITSASGGNFEQLAVNTTAAGTTVTDTADTSTVSLTASPSVAEGGQITYTASLTAAAQSPVTVTLSNGATITIPAGASTGTVHVAAPSDDVYADAGTVSATIASASGGNFEQLQVNPAAATTAVTDTADTTTVSLGASPAVAEGGQITYTASLTAAAQSAVTVTLDNGAVITIAAGATSGSVSVNAPAEDVYLDAGSVSAAIASASGGNFENLAVDTTAAATTVSDTIDDTTVSLTATPSVAEGGTIVYTASLTAAAQTDVTVSLSNGATITIAAGASSGTVNVPAPAEDVHVDAGNVSATISTASGGNFERLLVDGTAAVTAVSDTTTDATVSLSATPSVAEGGQITYTASLSAPAQSPVAVQLSNGATISIAAGASTGSVSVPAPADDVYADAGSVSATISSATGGNFENLLVNPAAATTTVTDTIDTTTVSLTATPTVAEGGQIVYTASLNNPAQGAVTVTLSNGATITIPAGSSAGSVNVPAPTDDTVIDAGNVSATISSAAGGNFENLVVNGTPAVTAVADTVDTTTVSLAASGSVAEGGNIVYTASLTSAAQSPVTVTLSNGATITIAAGASSGSVSVPAPTDDVYLDAGNVSATISAASGGNFENLAVNPAAATTAITDTVNTTTVSLTASPTVAEGGQITYTASLTAPAQGAVTVTLSNGATLTIPAGASSASVNVAAPSEDVYLDAGNVSATISAATGGGFEQLAINPAAATTAVSDTVDNTTVSLTATPSVAEGGQIVYTASLTSAAQSPVTVTLSNGATINIAAGASSGSVSVAAPADDVYVDAGNVSATISAASGGNFENLVVSNAAAVTAVTDDADATTLSLTGATSVTEGGSATYTLSLTSPAQTAVTVTLGYGGTAANGSDYTGVTTVTIPAGSSSVSFDIATVNDSATEGTESFTVSLVSATGGGFESLALSGSSNAVSTSVIDNDAPPAIDLDANNSSGAGGTGYTATFTENGAAVAIADADVAITDVDSTSLTGATITLTNAQAGDVLAAGALPAGISASVSGNTVTLSGAASLASYQAAIRAITFTNTGENPSTTPRSITVAVTDGTSSSNTATTTVNVVAVNDVPVNSVPAAQTTAEDTVRVFNSASGNAITVADADGGSLTVTVSVTSGTLSAAAFAGATLSNNGTGSVTITGSAAAINGALNGLAYNPVADYNGSAMLTVSTSDGVAAPVVSSVPITVTPVVDITNDTVSTNEDAAVTVAVLGTDNFENAGRTITAVNGSGITAGGPAVAVANGSVQLNAGGTLTFTPAANYNGPASFTYTVSSGGVTETATVNVTVNAVNDAPALDLDDNNSSGAAGAHYTASFTENGSSVSIGDADLRITDVDGATLAGATITLTNAQAGDVLAAGALPAGISATVSGNSITLSGSASLAAYETAIRAITFSNTSENPGTTPRTIQVTVNDGVNGSNLATATINVVSVNDAPVAVATPASGLEDAAFIAVNLAGTDVDGSIAAVRVTALPANGTLFLADGVTQVAANAALTPAQAAGLRFVPTADWSGSTQLSFTVTDNQGLTSAAVQNPITVTAVADQPTLASWTTAQVNVTEDWQDNNTSAGQMVWTSSDGYVEVNTQPAYNSLQNPNTALTPANNRVAEIEVDAGAANWIQTTIEAPLAGQVMQISFDTLRRTLSGTTDSNTQSFDVIWNGTVVGTYNPTTGAWLSPTIEVTSIAGTNTLRFSATDQAGSIGAVIDHVNVRTVADGYEDTAVRLPSLAGSAVFGDIPDNSEQHTLSLTGIPVGATVSDGTRSFTATAGNTSVVVFNEDNPGAASGGANWNLANLTLTPPPDFNGTLSVTATATAVELANGSTASASSTLDLVIRPVNDAPVAQASAVTAVEDTLYTFTLADFAATDVDAGSSAAAVTITSLPASGDLYFNGALVTTTGLTVTAADFAAGRLQFRGDANESGSDAYGQAGSGNQRSDYASFNFSVVDNQGAASNTATMTVDVTPVADTSTMTGASTALPASTGLTMTRHDNVVGLDGTQSQTLSSIEPAVEADGVAATSTVTGITTAAGVSALGNDDAYRVSGFVYLQAGQTYSFGGSFEDTLTLEIGGQRLAGFAHDGSTSDDESFSGASFTPAVSGYYSVELITYNVGGDAGFANLNVSVNGGAAVPFNTTNFNLYANAGAITASGTAGSFVPAADAGTGSNAAMSTAGYYQRRGASVVQGEEVLLPTLAAGFGDSADNSERHTITLDLSGAPVGTRVFVDANGDGIPDDGRVFTVSAGNTSVVVFDEDNPAAAAGGANWALGSIAVDTPAAYTGNFTINAVSRADEVANGSVVDTGSSTLAIPIAVVSAQNLAPSVENTSATVSEEGLAAGIADTAGTSDTTDSATVTGTVNVADTLDTTADSVTSVTLLPPNATLTSNGVAITWSGSGTGTLVGTAGGETVATLSIDNSGAYTFTLSGPIDHAGTNVEDVLSMNFGVVASDGVNSGSGTLTINVEDDSVEALTPIAAEMAVTDTNLMIVLDVSGSMADASGIPGMTRLQAAVQSLGTLLDRYDEFGSVAVRLVTFSSGAAASGSTWMTVADAKATLATLVASGGTNYDAAITTAMTAFGAAGGRIAGAQNVSYFFSDGVPTSGQEIGAADEANWTTFLDNNQVRSFAIGMGTGVPQAPMNPIAYNGQNNEAANAVVVTDLNQLDDVLAGTIQNPVAGPLVTGGNFGSGALVGADGGQVHSITVNGTTYTYDAAGAGSIIATGGSNNGVFDTATNTLTVTTAAGGRFVVDMDDGDYRYSAPAGLSSSIVETMDYVVTDHDGDTQASSVSVEVDRTLVTSGTTSGETLTGTSAADLLMGRQGNDIIVGQAGRDELLGGAGNDQLSGGDGDDTLSASVGADTLDGGAGDDRLTGGSGNDQLTGGLGADVFAWQLVDRGTGGAPAADVITDFNVASPAAGGDTLDLRDLLQSETSSNLSRFLDFDTTSVPGSTVIRISSSGGFAGGNYSAAAEDQRITLEGVDLRSSLGLGGGASDDQVIQELLNRGKLITDGT